jgi:hypothetical protein
VNKTHRQEIEEISQVHWITALENKEKEESVNVDQVTRFAWPKLDEQNHELNFLATSELR